MSFGFKTLIAAGALAASVSAASAMPMAGAMIAPQADTVHAEKTAIVCLGRCYGGRRLGYYRPGFRPAYGAYAYRPYALYRPHAYGYYHY